MSESVPALPMPGTIPFETYSTLYLKILDKRGDLVPFNPNPAQLELLDLIRSIRAEGRPVRIIILKARQLGFSTLSLGLQYEYCTSREGAQSLMLSYDEESATDLFERVHLMHEHSPIRPMTRFSNRRELHFANPDKTAANQLPGLNSKIRLGTAGRTRIGRSKTLRFVHASELAFWENPKKAMLALENALANDADTIEIIESTANGVGGVFYDRWQRANNPEARGDWRPFFAAWFKDPTYTRPLVEGRMEPIPSCAADAEAFLEEEETLRKEFQLTQEQLNWRRWAIVNKCDNSLEQFRQEYPSTPEEAFLTTGRPVFNRMRLFLRKQQLEAEDQRRTTSQEPMREIRGELTVTSGSTSRRIAFKPLPEGRLYVYGWPVHGRDYWIGADSAQGVTIGEDTDNACAQVIDRFSFQQVACWWGKAEPKDFAYVLERLGYYYNTAMLVPEVNNHGHTVVAYLEDWRYPRIFMREDFDHTNVKLLMRPGWETNAKTRPLMIDAVRDAINDGTLVLNHLPTIHEHMTFIRNEKGKTEADKGCKDDCVTAMGCVLAGITHGIEQPNPQSSSIDAKLSPDARMVQRHLSRLRHAHALRQQMNEGQIPV